MTDRVEFTYINSDTKLKTAVTELFDAKIIAVDLECENNLHHYGMYISLIQLSTKKSHWIVDVLALDNIDALIPVFEDSSIEKIFHDVSFDLRILRHQFKCYPKNIFDSELAARFLMKENIGLGSLLDEYYGFEKQKKFQMADWTKRPLTEEMLSYAIQDTSFLIGLRNHLKDELKAKDLWPWADEEFAFLEVKELNNKLPSPVDLKGFKQLSNVEKTIVKRLFILREKFAKKVNMPPHFVMNNRHLFEIAKQPPRSVDDWKKLRGVHPVVKSQAKQFFNEIILAKNSVEEFVDVRPKRYSQEQRDYFSRLGEVRDSLAKKYKLYPHLILSKEQMQYIVVDDSFSSLRAWQQTLILPMLRKN